jgi:hypothetical protein
LADASDRKRFGGATVGHNQPNRDEAAHVRFAAASGPIGADIGTYAVGRRSSTSIDARSATLSSSRQFWRIVR